MANLENGITAVKMYGPEEKILWSQITRKYDVVRSTLTGWCQMEGITCWNHVLPQGVLRCSLSQEPPFVVAFGHCAYNQSYV